MGDEKRVRYLKIDRGRYSYKRRVPLDLQPLLGPRWLIPCGDVTFAKPALPRAVFSPQPP